MVPNNDEKPPYPDSQQITLPPMPPRPSAPPATLRPSSAPSPSSPPRPSTRPSMHPRISYPDTEWLNEDTRLSRITETAILVPPALRDSSRGLLTMISGFNAGQVFRLDERENIIGRGRTVSIRLEDAGVSRQHARIVHTLEGPYVIEDLRSTNGTFVGSRKVVREELRTGDHIRIGPNVTFSFMLLSEAEETLARQLYESSTRDALTKVFNRKYLLERLASEIAYATRHASRLGLILFDLDHFKQVNDVHGHLAGDEVLKAVTQQVARMIRAEDVLARFGGEEFVVLVRGIEPSNVSLFAERLRRAVEKLEIPYEGKSLRITLSAGVSLLNECGETPTVDELLLSADARLYRAKDMGRNRVCHED